MEITDARFLLINQGPDSTANARLLATLQATGLRFHAHQAHAPGEIQALLHEVTFDAVLIDYKHPRLPWCEVLSWLHENASPTPLVVRGTPENLTAALAAMKSGLEDLVDPHRPDHAACALLAAVLKNRLARAVREQGAPHHSAWNDHWLLHPGRSACYRLHHRNGHPVLPAQSGLHSFAGLKPDADWIHWDERIHESDRSSIAERRAAALRQGRGWFLEYRLAPLKGGTLRVVDWACAGRCTETGEPRWWGVVVEVSHFRGIEEKLRLQKAALEEAANSIVITDREGTILWGNESFLKASGYAPEEILGQNHRLIKSGKQPRSYYHHLWETISRGEIWQGELINRRKDGALYTIEQTITPVKNRHGEVTHFIGIGQDITDKKNLQAQLLRVQRIEGIGNLASGIAHDLNNLLTPVLLSTQYLRDQLQDPTSVRFLNMIESSAERAAGVIRQVLAFSRGIRGERIMVNPRHLIKEMEKMLRETFPRSIRLDSEVDDEMSSIYSDVNQLHQVILNLCHNAREQMPRGGRLTLACHQVEIDRTLASQHPGARPGPYICIRITDTGPGITDDVGARMYDPFFTTKPPGEGSGLGLSTALGIVRAHGGFIHSENQPDGGASFAIHLPVHHADAASDLPPGELPPSGEGRLVLVADDEPEVLEITCQILEQNGYRTLPAQDGPEALALLARNLGEVDIAVTDLMMPIMEGSVLICSLQKMKPGLRIAACSGRGTRDEEREARDLGVRVFIPKPYTAPTLLHAVARLWRDEGDPSLDRALLASNGR
ncbi:MAG: response regulator [Puniceicoccaceae bacterium]|nr:MAG: response regulator [Puniceicoccaceae bacterium]